MSNSNKFIDIANKHLLLLIGLGILLRIIVLLLSPPIGDITNAYRSGMQFLLTKTVYGEIQYPYPPPVIWYNAFTLYFSEVFHLKFLYINKLLSLGCDIGTIFVLYKILKKKVEVLLYVFNPIIILVSATFGKEEPYIILLTLLAYIAFQKVQQPKSAVLLSISIAIKIFTVLLVPLFILKVKKLSRKIILLIITFLLPVSLMIPFLLGNINGVTHHIVNYAGVVDYGWLAILKSASALIGQTSINFSPYNPLLSPVLNLNKYVFLFGYFLLLLRLQLKHKTLLEEIIIVFLTFYILYGGIGTNFLYWIIPFLLIYNSTAAFKYTMYGSFAVAGYIITQFYEPVLKHIPFFLFQTPSYLNFFYLLSLIIFYIYMVKLFVKIYRGK